MTKQLFIKVVAFMVFRLASWCPFKNPAAIKNPPGF
jgi:hypothetical protein